MINISENARVGEEQMVGLGIVKNVHAHKAEAYAVAKHKEEDGVEGRSRLRNLPTILTKSLRIIMPKRWRFLKSISGQH